MLGLIAWGWLVAIQLLHWRDWQSLKANLPWNFVRRMVLSLLAMLPFLAAGVAVLGQGIEGLYWLVAGYGLLDPRGVVRRMGAARRDQAVSVGSSKPRILREGRYYEAGALRNLHNEVWPW